MFISRQISDKISLQKPCRNTTKKCRRPDIQIPDIKIIWGNHNRSEVGNKTKEIRLHLDVY